MSNQRQRQAIAIWTALRTDININGNRESIHLARVYFVDEFGESTQHPLFYWADANIGMTAAQRRLSVRLRATSGLTWDSVVTTAHLNGDPFYRWARVTRKDMAYLKKAHPQLEDIVLYEDRHY